MPPTLYAHAPPGCRDVRGCGFWVRGSSSTTTTTTTTTTASTTSSKGATQAAAPDPACKAQQEEALPTTFIAHKCSALEGVRRHHVDPGCFTYLDGCLVSTGSVQALKVSWGPGLSLLWTGQLL